MTNRLYGQGPDQRESSVDWDKPGGRTTDERRFSVQATTGRHLTATSLRRALAACTALALGGVGAACSAGGDSASRAAPTFHRAGGDSLAYTEPVSSTSDLVAPAAEGDPWTIVGSLMDPGEGVAQAAVWTSPDAREWERTAVDPHRGGVGESMAAAVPTDDGLLAVGRVGDGDGSDGAVWRQDGDRWVQARPEAMAGDHEQWAFDVASGAGGTLVAGGENAWGEVRARLWFSDDGETWATVDGGPGGPLDATGDESVRDVAPFGDGFVAVGSRRADNEQDGAVWYSADGRSWEPVDTPGLSGPGRQEVTAVVDTGTGLVAGGFTDDGTGGPAVPVMWTSSDARTWTGSVSTPLPLHADTRSSGVDMTVRSLTVGPNGILAAGGNQWRPHVWQSGDGQTWSLLANPVHGDVFQDGFQVEDAASFGAAQAVAIGPEPAVGYLGARWEDVTTDAFPRGGAQPFASAVAETTDVTVAAGGHHTAATPDARERYSGQVWRRNGNDWEPVDSEPLTSGWVMDVVPIAGGFAAVGMEDFGTAYQRRISGDQLPDAMVWISQDGATWGRIGMTDSRIDDAYLQYLDDPSPDKAATIVELERQLPPQTLEPAGGTGTQALAAVAPIDNGFIAVGWVFAPGGDTDPIVVSSGDGVSIGPEQHAVGGPGNQRLNDVCVGPDGTAVAVGMSGSTGSYDAMFIRRNRADGTWAAASVPDGSSGGPGSQIAYGCAAGPDGFVVVGSDDASGDTDARAWTSEDGEEWTLLDAGGFGGGGDQWASAAAAVADGDEGEGWLVAGTDTAHGDGDIALWRISPDGEVSRRDEGERDLGGAGDQTVTNVVVDPDGRVMLAGTDYGRVGLWESDVLDR
jgi:hypothetical protein